MTIPSTAKSISGIEKPANTAGATRSAKLGRAGGKHNALVQLEAFFLQNAIGAMLPQNATRVYGKGNAGQVWKSFLSEYIAAEIARSGQTGIADKISAAS